MFERFFERLSLSEFKDKFVLKGGVLVAAIVGMDARSTMDLDATVRGIPLTEENILKTISAICTIPVNDWVNLNIKTVSPIRADDVYGGYRVKIDAIYDTIEVPFSVDISTNDVITPQPVKHTFQGILDDNKQIELWVYNIETIMAEKIETVLRRNVLNTRPRDLYDIYILSTTQNFNSEVLKQAISATAEHRGTTEQISNIDKLLEIISNSIDLRKMWEKYRKEFNYASDISYDEVIGALRNVCYPR